MEKVVQELDLNYAGFAAGIEHSITQWEKLEEAAQQAAKQNPFKKQADDLLKFNNQLKSGGQLFLQNVQGPKLLKAELTRLTTEYVRAANAQKEATKPGDFKKAQDEVRKLRAEIDALNKKYDETIAKQNKAAKGSAPGLGSSGGGSKESGGLSGKLLGGASSVLGAFGVGLGAAEIITGIVSVRSEYQKLEKQLTVTLGSQGAAAQAQKLITDFANKTPHDVASVTSAFNRLVDVGIVPTEKQLLQLSDIALSKGKAINDYVELIADAQQGEFGRLAEFGLKASKNGDQVSFTFKGVTTSVKNTTEAINDYLIGLGSVAGVAGQTAEAGKTLEGRYSTLKDTFAGIANTIGTILQPALEGLLNVAQKGADGLSNYLNNLVLVYQQSGLLAALGYAAVPFGGKAKDTVEEAKAKQKEDDYRSGKTSDETNLLGQKRDELAAQNRRAAAERAAADAKAKAEKEAKEAAKQAVDQAAKLLAEKTKLEEDLQKLEDDFDKLRLERLDKSSKEYLELKQKIDLKEIEQLRAHLIKQGQEATGYYVKNTKTGDSKKVNNLNYQLPGDKEAILQQMRDATAPDYYENNTKRQTDLIKTNFTEQLEKDELTRQKKYGDLELELRNKLVEQTDKLTREAGESEIDYEQRKAEKLLQIKLDYYKKILALAEKDPFADQSAVTGFKETIQQIEGELKKVKEQGKTGPTNLFQLFGLTFTDENGKDITSEVEKQVGKAVDTAISATNSILNEQISADQARIDSIDQQLAAKQNEIDVELELQKQGLANNLSVKREEYAALQEQRQKEVAAQRAAQKVQLAINAALQASELALAVAKIFRADAGVPVLGLIAAGVETAALLAAFITTVSQISSLPKYHDGDEITSATAQRRSTADVRKPNEIDIRAEVGEGVIRKKSYQANKRLFRYLNTVDRPVALHDLTAYVRDNPFGMLETNQQQGLQQITQYYELKGMSSQPDQELHKRVDGLQNTMHALLEETRKGRRVSRTVLSDGRVKEVDENGNVTVSRLV